MTKAKRLLLFNLRTDADDAILGFTTQWIHALAPYFDAIDVLTMHQGRLELPDGVRVYSVGREKGYSNVRRVIEFYRVLIGLLLRHRYEACFAHMMPLFAAMGGVLLSLRGVPMTLWYTHRQINWQVRMGMWLSRRVVTAVPSSFPIITRKLRPIGHGIDTDFYTPSDPTDMDTPVGDMPRIVYVARLTPIKHQHILIHAIQAIACEVILIGDIPDGFDDAYKRELQALVAKLDLSERVRFVGAQTPERIRTWLHTAQVAVNLSPMGLFDKAALESMSCGVPTIVSNAAFSTITSPYEGQLHISDSEAVEELSQRLRELLTLSPGARRDLGLHLRDGVMAHHSLGMLARRLVSVLITGEAT